jgi:hypothetical protein
LIDMSDFQKALQDLKDTRQEVSNLVVPAEVHLLKCLERSARAEVKLRLKHLQWLAGQRVP